MKAFLKQSGYTFLILILSFLIGGLLGTILAFPLRLVVDMNERQTDLLHGVFTSLVSAIVLFIAEFKESYEKRQFVPKLLIGSFLLITLIHQPIGLLGEYGFTVAGSAGPLARAIFLNQSQYYFLHNGVQTAAYAVTMLGIDLLIFLPAILLGGYFGCKKRNKEIEEMKKEYESRTN